MHVRALAAVERETVAYSLESELHSPELVRWSRWLDRSPLPIRSYVTERGGRVIGHVSAIPKRTWIAGDEVSITELVGGWSRPSEGLAKISPYRRCAEALFADHQGPSGDLIYHLEPEGGERRLGHRYLEYQPVNSLPVLTKRVGLSLVEPSHAEPIAEFDEQAKWLWDRTSDEFGASTIRDASFLNHRFGEHPLGEFTRLGVRDSDGVLRGYAVVRPGRRSSTRRFLWIHDWLVPSSERGVGLELQRAAEHAAREAGCPYVATYLPTWSPWFGELQDQGFRVRASSRFLFARSKARRFDAYFLRDRWWNTLADTIVEPEAPLSRLDA